MTIRLSTAFSQGMLNYVRTAMPDGAILVYTGAQPASADDAPTGTYLGMFTKNAGPWSPPSSVANGIDYSPPAVGALKIVKPAGDVWQCTAVASGRAGWYRYLPGNVADPGSADTTATYFRQDGRIGTTGADLNLSVIDFEAGATYTISDHEIALSKLPAS